MQDRTVKPHWERGYRRHGYWVGMERVGYIGIEPRFHRSETPYGWDADTPYGYISGKCKTLREAKRMIEKAMVTDIAKSYREE